VVVKKNKHTEKKKRKLPTRKANELNGSDWLKRSISIWTDISKTNEEQKLNHPAMFPKEIPRRIMEMFLTKDKTKVLDPFMGSGSTLLAAKEIGKNGIGFEISKEYAEVAEKRMKSQSNLIGTKEAQQTIIVDDARNMTQYLQPETIDLCITSPPYWNILTEKRTADQKNIRNYHKKDGNIGEIYDYESFLQELKAIFEKVYSVLKGGAYCVINVMDIRKKDKYYPLHMDTVKFMQELGFIFDDIIIWDRRKEYNNLRPLGYPFVFRVNKVHEYILIFLKPCENLR
jgi:DNA modification methylase